MSDVKLKEVRALRTGFYYGHRRRAGAVFTVDADASEQWFEDVGPAPEGAELPARSTNANPPAPTGFIEAMKELGQKDQAQRDAEARNQQPQTLAEAVQLNPAGVDAGASLI